MEMNLLTKIFEHNNWANLQIVKTCLKLEEKQLDEKPLSTSEWSIRETLTHLVESQEGYLSLLTIPTEERKFVELSLEQLENSIVQTGERLLALAVTNEREKIQKELKTRDGYIVKPWVVMVQVINHATEHRRQLRIMLKEIGVIPPDLDSWSFGEFEDALVPISK